MGYVIVIHWVPRDYGSKRTESEDEVCLRCHNSLATSESLIYLTTSGNLEHLGYAFSIYLETKLTRIRK